MKKFLTILEKNISNYVIFIIIIIIDQLTKFLSIDSDIIVIPNLLKFTYIKNTGAILGIFEKNIVLITDIIIIIGILIYWKKSKKSNIRNLAFTLIISGTIGNLLDRIFKGYVIDFIKLTLFDNMPIFNIADISIFIGFIILIILGMKDFIQKN